MKIQVVQARTKQIEEIEKRKLEEKKAALLKRMEDIKSC